MKVYLVTELCVFDETDDCSEKRIEVVGIFATKELAMGTIDKRCLAVKSYFEEDTNYFHEYFEANTVNGKKCYIYHADSLISYNYEIREMEVQE